IDSYSPKTTLFTYTTRFRSWREAERKRRQRDFLVAMGGAVVAAVIVAGLTAMSYSRLIDHQNERNARLKTEIAELDKSIKEIDRSEEHTSELQSREKLVCRL